MRFARQQERFLPLRVAEVDVHRPEAGAAQPLDRGGQVGHLEREVMRTGAVPRDEAGEEVVLFGRPRFEQFDAHAVAVGIAHEDLHRTEADGSATEDDGAAQRAGEEPERLGGVGRRERDVVEGVLVARDPIRW